MNPLQKHAIQQAMRARGDQRTNISTATLVGLARASSDLAALPPIPAPNTPLAELKADIAICVGGGNDPMAEYDAALAVCKGVGKSVANFVCNDTLMIFPHAIQHGVTLHPDKWPYWHAHRGRSGFPMPNRLWAHRLYDGFSDHTKDWQGSSGLFMVKIARELGYTHIILAGIPMNIEGKHFVREQAWNAAPGFRRGWARVQGALRPFVRSMSGWTEAHFGKPDAAWCASDIPDPFPMRVDHSGVKA